MSIFLENNTFFNTCNLRNSRIMLTHTHNRLTVGLSALFNFRIRVRKERLKHILQRLSVRIALAFFSYIFQPNIRS